MIMKPEERQQLEELQRDMDEYADCIKNHPYYSLTHGDVFYFAQRLKEILDNGTEK